MYFFIKRNSEIREYSFEQKISYFIWDFYICFGKKVHLANFQNQRLKCGYNGFK
jgi:hypothetical protein